METTTIPDIGEIEYSTERNPHYGTVRIAKAKVRGVEHEVKDINVSAQQFKENAHKAFEKALNAQRV
jgi:hypothetical protein